MSERSPFWQAIAALFVSIIVLVIVLFAAWLADRTDAALGHGPLPSTLGPRNAYIATLLTVLFGMLAGGALMLGVRQSHHITRRFAWLVYGLVCLPLLALLFTPMQRFGHAPFLSLPEFLMSMPARAVITVGLGSLLFSGIDLSRVMPFVSKQSARFASQKKETASPAQGPVKGLPGRFTPNAWRALSNMQEEAQRFEHAYMGTEHLLLGLLADTRSQASKVIVNLGGDPGGLRGQLEGVIGRRGTLYTGASGMTRRCQRVIEAAARFARSSTQRTVSTGHLLHALVEEPDDIAGQLLESAGVTAERIAGELRHLGPEGE
ncbi:MAG: Clp protease N-terminal domain-containing protein [Dehalococcoidia bacterium]